MRGLRVPNIVARPVKPAALSSRRHLSSSRALLSNDKPEEIVELAFQRHDPPEKTALKGPGPIIIMHGLFGSQRNNRTMSKVLAKDLSRPVYTLDLRNHGASPHSAVHTYTSMAQDVEYFLSSQKITNPTLIGHSMGAKVAMTLALRDPKSYSALIPVDNAPVDAALRGDFGTYVNAMKEIEETRPHVTRQSEADKILQKYEPDLGIRQFLLTNLVKMPPKGGGGTELRFRIPLGTLAKSLPNMADFPFKDTESHQYKGPTLMVRGTKSHYVADETLPVIGAFFPKFELLDVDCGHWVMSEAFEEFRKGVGDFVGRVVDEQ
ncbi:hypothetical protein H2200_003544 [Cladophialophora chaetospira]|uniref:AB hydrolase-1 domain-containing protein n=1 Tax=Cladophialophora chaetospira TaxID=386627 RepID=A0AA38XF76_9EURO|nr:hypothetical protein H2200_003544 [Cladophialophora chaetospira]